MRDVAVARTAAADDRIYNIYLYVYRYTRFKKNTLTHLRHTVCVFDNGDKKYLK